MAITRRTFFKTAGSAAIASGFIPALSQNAWSQSSLALGSSKIDVLSDGNLRLPTDMKISGVPDDEVKAFYKKHDLPTGRREPPCNLTLVRDGERTILFDVGSGSNFFPSAGKLSEAMAAIDLDPSEVTHVLFTHAHPDHLWGLLDEFDDPMFPDAEFMISKPEWDYWIDPDTVNTIGEARQSFAAGALRNLKAIEDQITRFDFENEILPGIRAIDTSGHTPGHAAFEVRSGSESIVIVGDALTSQYFSFEKPNWPSASDQDPEKGIAARNSLLDQLASDKMQMVAYHIAYPGVGRVEKADGAYRFVAA
ncbi:MAG: MBL fold metallo-hydrolase [Rhizobiaceae bacterium]|nr:MBL fold metallo-hydrolase [Rhizobiaceae bacterium]